MRALAQDSGHVPPRYQVEPNALYVEDGVIARGASSEIRKGRLGGKTVAVKTLKIDRQIDPHNVQVCPIQRFLLDVPTNTAPKIALLQRVHHLDERFSFPPLAAHRCRHRSSHRPVLNDLGNDAEREYQELRYQEPSSFE